ncbi:MAG: NAD(P)H-dependent oxidoreductase [Kaiparowitsia implicata GSE-PSE-MK54-09C]|jgi:glutathione-regulated potassium-efflux system ancillary protein KefG|nr:NAD(P)H-dependent oxidoreductase [Kaiparowitsia implicata GSE-PSE-MK54-09C]
MRSRSNAVLILFAHPAFEKSRINRALIHAVQGLEQVTLHDLYEVYPHFHIDVQREQELLRSHDIIIFHHPFYWYSSPALLKEWQDLVLEHGFAYGHEGVALQGKTLLSAITTGGGADAYCRSGYNHYTIRELLTPFERTATLCGMAYLPPFVVHGTHQLQHQAEIEPHAVAYRQVVEALRDGRLNSDGLDAARHLNQQLDHAILADAPAPALAPVSHRSPEPPRHAG